MTLVLIVSLLALIVSVVAPPRIRAVLWVCAILAGVVPWTDYQGHSHWGAVGWWPFVSPPVRARDIVVNFILYLPLGWHVTRRHQWPVGRAVLAGLCVSLLTEFTQVYSHERFATMTDVVVNTVGALCGAWLAVRWPQPDRPSR